MDKTLFDMTDESDNQVNTGTSAATSPGGTFEAPEAPLLTRRSAQEQQETKRQGVRISLPKTKGTAIVRILTAEQIIAGGWLPQRLHRVMGEMLAQVGRNPAKVKDGNEAFKQLQKLAEEELLLADAIVCHAFINPQVVATEEDLDPDREDQIVVTQLDEIDRRAILRLMVGQNTQGDVKILGNFRP